ncbi:hypothetical protein [Singulisphaera sp. PoT]|uniref:hypothetical protein n=1 Tax=Singulisphaera sp. PoT TaxID=3411797 RepID=UPI003BF5B143
MSQVVVSPSALRILRNRMLDGVDQAGGLLAMAIKEKISVQGPPRSKPGDPPHIDSGDLIASYDHATDAARLTAHVGTPIPYAHYLEEGTDTMAARPHIIPALLENADDIARAMIDP